MEKYILTTDNTTDFAKDYFEKNGLEWMFLTYTLDGESYGKENDLPAKDFYEKMRAGSMPVTSQVNPEAAKEEFRKCLKRSRNIIHIAFSSGLSGTYNSARMAAEEIMEEEPDCRITVVDSLAASLGEGLLVYYAVQKKNEGMEYDELAEWLEQHKLNIIHNFTVDDLFHLYRGGRVSKATAVLGTMVNIKPILHVDEDGHLIPVSKVRGRKKSLQALVESMEKQIGSYRDKNDIVFISHGDCLEDAEYVKQLVTERFGIEKFVIEPVGTTIGAHSGPGTVALFYMGDVR